MGFSNLGIGTVVIIGSIEYVRIDNREYNARDKQGSMYLIHEFVEFIIVSY